MAFTVKFLDAGREPKCAPNPNYPNGIDVDMSHGAAQTCRVDIPYPSPRCGAQVVKCDVCGSCVALTVAGRPDDPKSVRIRCKEKKH